MPLKNSFGRWSFRYRVPRNVVPLLGQKEITKEFTETDEERLRRLDVAFKIVADDLMEFISTHDNLPPNAIRRLYRRFREIIEVVEDWSKAVKEAKPVAEPFGHHSTVTPIVVVKRRSLEAQHDRFVFPGKPLQIFHHLLWVERP